MLTKMTAFLARAPALQGLSLTVGDVGPAPYTAGLWCRGITVLDRRENLLGRVTQRCRAESTWHDWSAQISEDCGAGMAMPGWWHTFGMSAA